MDEYNTLAEAVSYLLDKGYSIDFEQRCKLPMSFKKAHMQNLTGEDFRVDEIFCCRNDLSRSNSCFVLGISSEKHHFKGIVTTPILQENPKSLLYYVRLLNVALWKTIKKYR